MTISRASMGKQIVSSPSKPVKMKGGGGVGKGREEKALETIGAIRRGAGGIPVYVAEGNVDVGMKKKASGGMINNRGDGMASRGFTRGRMC